MFVCVRGSGCARACARACVCDTESERDNQDAEKDRWRERLCYLLERLIFGSNDTVSQSTTFFFCSKTSVHITQRRSL